MGLLNIVIAGLVSGGLYGLTALGLVLGYRASRVLNFALGGIGGLAAYTAFALLEVDIPYAVAVVAALVVGALFGALAEVLVARPLRDADPLTIGIGTMGLLLILQGTIGSIWGFNTQSMPLPLSSVFTLQIGELLVGSASLFILVVTGLAVLGASLLGIDTATVRVASWSLSGACGALEAVMNFSHLMHLEDRPRTTNRGQISGSGPRLLRLAAPRKVHNRL